jgi:hypothetical protein
VSEAVEHNNDTTVFVQDVSVTVSAWGKQNTKVQFHRGAEGDAYICVQAGRTLTYCYDRWAVMSVCEALADAQIRGLSMEMQPSLPPPVEWITTEGSSIAVSARISGEQHHVVTGVGAQASPNGRAHINLLVGKVTLRFYDHESLECFIDVWSTAMECLTVFGPSGKAFNALRKARAAKTPAKAHTQA